MTLFELVSKYVRRKWHLYKDSTPKSLSDLIWQGHHSKLATVLKEFCADSIRDAWEIDNLAKDERFFYTKHVGYWTTPRILRS